MVTGTYLFCWNTRAHTQIPVTVVVAGLNTVLADRGRKYEEEFSHKHLVPLVSIGWTE